MQKRDSNPGLGLETPKSYHCTATLVVKNFVILLFILSGKVTTTTKIDLTWPAASWRHFWKWLWGFQSLRVCVFLSPHCTVS
jgi:hypothetical protein